LPDDLEIEFDRAPDLVEKYIFDRQSYRILIALRARTASIVIFSSSTAGTRATPLASCLRRWSMACDT
jgi:hypothetical protein